MGYRKVWVCDKDHNESKYHHNYIIKAGLESDTDDIIIKTSDGDRVALHKDDVADFCVYVLEGAGWNGVGQMRKDQIMTLIYIRDNKTNPSQGGVFCVETEYLDGKKIYVFDDGWITADQALIVANAILDDLGLGWKSYPDNRPDSDIIMQGFEVTVHPEGNEGGYVTHAKWEWDHWSLDNVIAFRPLPQPHKESMQ